MAQPTPARAAVYGRESAANRKSIVDQVRLGVDLATQQGWTHAGSYDDETSASRYARKVRRDWPRLLADLNAGRIDVVIVWETTRADRNLSTWVELLERCRATGVRIHVVADERTYDPRRARDYRDLATAGVDATYETDRLSERVRRGVAQHAQAGLPYGRLMFGYRREYDRRGAFLRQLPDPAQAAVVAELARRVDAGELLASIAADLNARGVPTPDGAQLWRGPRIREIVLRPAYRGARVWRGKVISEGNWPEIIDPAVQRRLIARLTDPGRRTQRGTALRWQLVGAGRCATCDTLLVSHSSGRTGRRHRVYACPTCWVSINAGYVDEFLDRLIIGRLRRPDAVDVFTPPGDDAAVEAACGVEADLRGQLDDWRRSAVDGRGTTPGSLAVVEAGLAAQIAAAASKVARLSRPAPLRDLDPVELAADWPDRPAAVRRDVIAALAQVRLGPRRTGAPGFDPWRLARSRWVGDELTWGQRWQAEGATP